MKTPHINNVKSAFMQLSSHTVLGAWRKSTQWIFSPFEMYSL